MSFRHYARKVRDPARAPGLRLAALRSCVSRFCWCTGQPYRETLARFGLGPPRSRSPPGDAFLLGTLGRIEGEREHYLAARAGFDLARREAKRAGGRQLSNAERERLRRLATPAATPLDAEAGG